MFMARVQPRNIKYINIVKVFKAVTCGLYSSKRILNK